MFHRLFGAVLKERHLHECRQDRNCGRALLHDTAAATSGHTLFNPAPPEGVLIADSLLAFILAADCRRYRDQAPGLFVAPQLLEHRGTIFHRLSE